ncbi:MAG: (deoxy)nucleoside triphosphate pyrophosphohydrolase [Bryobacteraceae bacterium]|nr:(deoxy)nucleoside triphosphate pyrophosphohydrolase [Bryobacteraceae bacterium]
MLVNAGLVLVVAAVLEREGQVLIAQRRKQDRHPLKWEFPGGKVETGESPREALARELWEELGVEAAIGEQMAAYEHQYAGGAGIRLLFFRVTEWTGEARNLTFEQIVWESPARFDEYDFLEADRDFVSRLRRGEL